MTVLTDVEISRALNALSATFRDQRPSRFDVGRAQEIVDGALAQEPKIEASATGATAGELLGREDGRLIAEVRMQDGQWIVERKLRAGESDWALPQPAHDEQAGETRQQEES